MNLTAAITEVKRITSRPDKTVDAIACVNRAISFFVLKGEFADDIVESTLAVNPTLYGATISLTSLTRFRRFTYIKPTAVRYYLTKIGADKVFTPAQKLQPNRYYIAGTNLTYTLSALTTALEIGYLQYPPILTEVVGNDTHWTLDKIPYAVIDYAAGLLYEIIGDKQSATDKMNSGIALFEIYKADHNQA